MRTSSKFLVSVAAILVAFSGVTQASALPTFSAKPSEPGKPAETGKPAALPPQAQAPGNLAPIAEPSTPAVDTGKPAENGKPAETGKPADSEKGKPEVVRNLVKGAKTADSTDTADLGPKRDYIVRFHANAVVGNEVSALKASKIAVGRTYGHVFKGLVAKMTTKQVAALAKRSTVAAIEADGVVELATSQAGTTWGIDRIDQPALPLTGNYDYTNTGAGVRAYIIDTGIYSANADFGGRVSAGFTAVADGNNTEDCNGHGTHVAGTVGSTTYGVAKSVTLVPVRVLDCAGSGSYSSVIAGIDWVAQNYQAGMPAVANLSLGGPISSSLDTAINSLINRGVTVVVAAGNSAADACGSSPARVPNAITVAASDRNDQFAYFSNYGSCVDLEAPGVNVTSTWIGSTTATNTISGTSMASPHVAGVVALMLSTGYRLPTQVAAELLAATTGSAVGAVPAGTVNKLLFSSPLGWDAPAGVVKTAPDAPTNVAATPATKSAKVTWVRTANDGGSPITGQTVKVWSGSTLIGTVSVSATASAVTVKNLRAGTSYQFSVLALNAIGSSPDSAKSASITIRR